MNFVNENQTYRFQILFELYRQSNADIDQAHDLQSLASNLGLNTKVFQAAYKYLYLQDLINMRPMAGGSEGKSNYYATITHRGVKAVEDALRNSNEATSYFPAYREMML